MLSKGGESRVTNSLATSEAKALEESTTSSSNVLNYTALYVNLELEEIHPLPVRSVQREYVPGFRYLSASAERDYVQM
jgi:hypothetical protein